MARLPSLSRRSWLAISGLLVFGVILFLVLRGESTQPAYVSPPILAHTYGAATYTGGKVRFFNGRAFVDYDPTTTTTSTLLANLNYPPVKDVQWNAEGTKALVTSIFHSPADSVGKRLAAAKQSLSAQRHWIVDIASGQLTLLPPTIERAQWNGYRVIGLQNSGGEETVEQTVIFEIDQATGSPKQLIAIPNLRTLFQTTTSELYVLRADRDEYVVSVVSGADSRELIRTTNDAPLVSPDGSSMAALDILPVDDEAVAVPPVVIRLIDTKSGKELKKLKGFGIDTYMSFLSANRFAAIDVASTLRIATHTLDTNKTDVYTSAKDQPPLGIALGAQQFGDGLLVQTLNHFQVVSFTPRSLPNPVLNYSVNSLSGDGFLIVKEETGTIIKSLTVNIYKLPADQRFRAALGLLRQNGLNPDLFDIVTDTSFLPN